MRLLRSILVWLSVGLPPANSAVAEPSPQSVLFLELSNQTRVWNFALSNAFHSIIDTNSARHVYSESLDINRFGGPIYEEVVRSYFRDKYHGIPIGVIVVPGPVSLDFFLSLHLWSGVPVIVAAIDEATSVTRSLPTNVTGRIMRLSFQDMVNTARIVVPGLKRIAVVGDPFERGRYRAFKNELPEPLTDLELIDLTGLAMAELRKRVATLPEDSAIAYTGITVDGSGMDYVPRDALAIIADVANRPIVSDAETYIGYGAVGGNVMDPKPIGEEAGRLALRLLDGESVSKLPLAKGDFTRPIFDWRQLARWGVSESRLPSGSEVRFRQPSLWDQYRRLGTAVLAVVLAQAAIIGWLIFERRRRRIAEREKRQRLLEVFHLNRSALAGALSASVAHELNQPLASIRSSAEAAELYLKADPPNLERVELILHNILQDDERAADIISHLRGLLKKRHADELQKFDLNDVVRDLLHILDPEALKRGMVLTVNCAQRTLPVRVDQIHLQQVILNLAMNGMDAMQDCAPGNGKLSIRTAIVGDSVKVSIADSGIGIPMDKLNEVFDTFFTTKQEGTGLGLSIARTIISAYGGNIWAENRPMGGAIFRFTLPLYDGELPA